MLAIAIGLGIANLRIDCDTRARYLGDLVPMRSLQALSFPGGGHVPKKNSTAAERQTKEREINNVC